MPTHAPQPLVTRPGRVSAFLSYHEHGLPLGVPRILQRWRGYFTSQVTPYSYCGYGLEATFLFPLLLLWGTGARGLLIRTVASYWDTPSTVFPTRGYRRMSPSEPKHTLKITGRAFMMEDAPTCQCPNLATPIPSDAHAWRRPCLATPKPGDAHTWRCPKRSTC